MHHALYIQEILLDIFEHCCPWTGDRRCSTGALAALARTCHSFKEPALNVLWSELADLTPLPRCIPEACSVAGRRYSFKRQPTEGEWNILRSYTRRVRHVFGHSGNPGGFLDNDSLIAICSPPVADPLFPNLRSFYWQGITMTPPAAHIAVPSLNSLDLNLTLGDVPLLKDFLGTIETLCPNIKKLRIHILRPYLFDDTIRSYIRRQINLRELHCHGVALDADIMSYLSRKSNLAHLSFTIFPGVPDWSLFSSSAFVFSTLAYLKVWSQSLEPINKFLSSTQLPKVENIHTDFIGCPSEETLRDHIMIIQNACSRDSLTNIYIRGIKRPPFSSTGHDSGRLTLDDVRPFMAFVNLRYVYINVIWSVDLTDSDLHTLVSAWPYIHTILINEEWGWRTTHGITLLGLLQLLQMRRSLSALCVAIRADSYTDLPYRLETGFLAPSSPLKINFADSTIRPADVPELVDVFVKLGLPANSLQAWRGVSMGFIEDAENYKLAWEQVFGRVEALQGT